VNFRRLVIAIGFLSILIMASRPMVDPDTWWHLRTGQWILDHRMLLTADPFSFTRFGEAYYYPAWLSQILMAGLFSIGGLPLLNLLFTSVLILAFLLVYSTLRGDAFLTVLVLVLAAVASEIYWSARPQLFTFLFGACFYFVIRRFLLEGKNALWILPPIMLLWVNMHPGFIVGFILLGVAVAGRGVKYLAERSPRNPKSGNTMRWLLGITAACLAAACINPIGPAIFAYPLETVSVRFLLRFIQEWRSPDFHTVQAQIFLALFLLAWTAIAFSPERPDITDYLHLVVFGVMGFVACRNTYLLSIVAPAVIMRHGDPILRRWFPRWNPDHPVSRRESVAQSIILAVAAVGSAVWIVTAYSGTERKLMEAQQPAAAVEYLKDLPEQGRMFNAYNWGSYLVWAVPSRPVFVDGRTDLYGDEILDEYIRVIYAQEGWRDILRKWDIRLVFVEPTESIVPVLLADGWTEGYRDSQAIILLRPETR
jgi:hypothetical protein